MNDQQPRSVALYVMALIGITMLTMASIGLFHRAFIGETHGLGAWLQPLLPLGTALLVVIAIMRRR